MPDIKQQELLTLIKLGSIAVHVDELLSADGHEYDRVAIETLLRDSDLQRWIAHMTTLGYLPVKRIK